ncbi:pentatricopeptide repeat-containing protein [Pyrus ussuriensis x Pyrus communis]|uniref:Pentatricopeptide repeat-containing protein n=1 Tax=Pyrus ussuriensis x Pyrus communis TaxID=2448454 RepID=A0A5N5FLM9_9ROSA|nr:pentatricopeptide repeat-containing protein [Pyrus ussuriensis x Pyrus communis]
MAGSTWAEEVVWHGPWFGLPRLCYLPRRRKLLEFNFSISIDEVIEYGVAKIGATEDKVSSEQTTECEVAGEGRIATKEPKRLAKHLATKPLIGHSASKKANDHTESLRPRRGGEGFVAKAMTWAARLDQSQRLAQHGQKKWCGMGHDAVIEDGAAKIKAIEDEVSSEQIAECEVAAEGIMAAFVLWALGPWWSLPPFSKATWDLYRLWLFDVVTCASGTAFEPAKRCLSGDGNDPPERAGGCIVDWFLDGSSKTLCSEMELHVLNPFQALNSKLQATGPRDSKPSNKLLAWFEPKTGVDDVGLARELAQGCLREAQPLAGFSFWTKGISPAYWAGFVVASRG